MEVLSRRNWRMKNHCSRTTISRLMPEIFLFQVIVGSEIYWYFGNYVIMHRASASNTCTDLVKKRDGIVSFRNGGHFAFLFRCIFMHRRIEEIYNNGTCLFRVMNWNNLLDAVQDSGILQLDLVDRWMILMRTIILSAQVLGTQTLECENRKRLQLI